MSVAFLLAQVGAHAAAQFAERLATLELIPQEAGVLRAVAGSPGISQRELAKRIKAFPSRLVVLLDRLEQRGLLERRDGATDRRVYALHLSAHGQKTLLEIGAVARAHEAAICAGLDAREKEALARALGVIAAHAKLTPGVHPGLQGGGGPPGANTNSGGARPRSSRRRA